jgi:rfaE bifunctional protein nucleotidyltransferase chain/domain
MESKLITREQAVALRQAYGTAAKKVGYTSGVFDILHSGHVEYLEAARACVDVLVVGINSDQSVRENKGPDRPINTDQERARVVAGLTAVDHVFIFGERNNNRNVELLKPDVYLKAGDYSAESLSSKSIVESYGGRVELVPFRKGFSTTSVIEKISLMALSDSGEKVSYQPQPAVFIDRDGTINEHIEYLSEPEKFKEIPGAFDAMRRLRERGFRVIIVTNQPGIGLGYFTREDLFAVNREMMRQATRAGASIDKIYFCPHSKADKCRCRKPGVLFAERAAQELSVQLEKSFVVGDMSSDVQFGIDAGCTPILVQTGRGGSDDVCAAKPAHVTPSLRTAVDWILEQVGPSKA